MQQYLRISKNACNTEKNDCTIGCKPTAQYTDEQMFIMKGILGLGHCLRCKYQLLDTPRIGIVQDWASKLYRCLKMDQNICGWLPCYGMRLKSDGCHETMYVCKGCRLIKYCCRKHQKKHWKFIHRWQCREY